MSVAIALAALVFAVVLGLSARRPWTGALVCVALVPWDGLEIDPGIRLTAYRLALFGWITAIIVRKLSRSGQWRPGDSVGSLSIWAIAFLAYSIAWTFAQLPIVPTTDVVGSTIRSVPQFRSLGQMGWLLVRFAPLLLLPAVVWRIEEAVTATRVYLGSLTVLVLVGCVQIVVWMGAGVDIAPIGSVANLFGGTSEVRHGILPVLGRRFLRMSSFGGEPKSLGQSLAIGLLLIQAAALLKSVSLKKLGAMWVLFFLAMLATASTSALFVWAGGSVLLAAYFLINFPARRFTVTLYTWGLVALCGLVLTGAISATGLTPGEFGSIVEARTVGRRLIPDSDLAVWAFLEDNPIWAIMGVGLGNIHLYAGDYIPSFARHYMESSVFVAKSGYLRLVSEVGLFGLGFFLVWMWWEISAFRRGSIEYCRSGLIRNMRVLDAQMILRTLAAGFTVIIVIGFLARGYVWDHAVWTVAMIRSVRKGDTRIRTE